VLSVDRIGVPRVEKGMFISLGMTGTVVVPGSIGIVMTGNLISKQDCPICIPCVSTEGPVFT